MSQLSPKKYFAKQLLFGEYTIINGGQALAIPFKKYHGSWTNKAKNADLSSFWDYLIELEGSQKDLIVKIKNEGVSFESSIPQGYGCGSSGAISAAVYDQFFIHKQFDHLHLKQKLGEIENFFHDKSSGLDPLVSYLNKAVFFSNKKINILDPLPSTQNLFLIDSERERTTSKWVKIFNSKFETSLSFRKQIDILNKYNSHAIASFILNDQENLKVSFKKISEWQRIHFVDMIPDHIKTIWDNGLQSDAYYIKLSGAGGGGFFLGFSQNESSELPHKHIYL